MMRTLQQAIETEDLASVQAHLAAKVSVTEAMANKILPLDFAFNKIQESFSKTAVDIFIAVIGAGGKLGHASQWIELCELLAIKNTPPFFPRRKLDIDQQAQCLRAINAIIDAEPAMVNQLDSWQRSPLWIAVEGENVELCRALISKKADLGFKDRQGGNLFHQLAGWEAPRWGNALQLVDDLLKYHPETRDYLNQTAGRGQLYSAIDVAMSHKNIALFRLFRQSGAEPKGYDKLGLWNFAYENKDTALLEELLQNGIAQYKDERGVTALYMTFDDKWVLKLIQHGAEINTISEKFGTPIYQHILRSLNNQSDTAAIECLLNNGADLECLDSDKHDVFFPQQRPLSFQVADLLLQYIDVKKIHWQTLIHKAVRHYQWQFARSLMGKNIDLSVADKDGKLAIEYVYDVYISKNPDENMQWVVERLVQQVPDVLGRETAQKLLILTIFLDLHNAFVRVIEKFFASRELLDFDIKDCSPLLACMQEGKEEFLNTLLTRKINPNYQVSQNRCSALHIAVQYLNTVAVTKLIEAGASVFLEDSNGNWPIVSLCRQFERSSDEREKHFEKVKTIFLALYAKHQPNQKNSQEKDLLQIYSQQTYSEYGRYFVRKIILDTLTLPAFETQKRLLPFIVGSRDQELARIFLTRNAGAEKNTLLLELAILVVRQEDEKFLQFLFLHDLPPNCTLGSGDLLLTEIFNNPKHSRQLEQMAVLAICKGAEVHVLTEMNFLHTAIVRKWKDAVKALLPYYRKQLNQHYLMYGGKRKTFLQTAVCAGHKEIVADLIAAGADPKLLDEHRKSLLLLACEERHVELVRYFHEEHKLSIGALYKKRGLWDANEIDCSALDATLENKIEDREQVQSVIEYLLAQGCVVTAGTIYVAMRQKLAENLIINLLKKLPDVAYENELFLHQAVRCSYSEVTNWLLINHAEKLVSVLDVYHNTALHVAAQHGLATLYRCMLGYNANPEQLDYLGNRSFHHAWYLGKNKAMGWTSFSDGVSAVDFAEIFQRLDKEKEFQHVEERSRAILVGTYARRLLVLLRSVKRVSEFIDKNRGQHSSQPIHDMCLFNLPDSGATYDNNAWAELALEYGKELTSYFHWAGRIDSLLGRAPKNLEEVKKASDHLDYAKSAQNPELAALFLAYQIPETGFNLALQSLANTSPDNDLPDINIDGETLDSACQRFYFRKLPRNDNRGFILGAMTFNCQSIGSAGQACALHGMQSKHGGFYVIFKKTAEVEMQRHQRLLGLLKSVNDYDAFINKITDKEQRKKYRADKEEIARRNHVSVDDNTALHRALLKELEIKLIKLQEGELIAQSWSWFATDGSLVFDSWERKRDEDDVLSQYFLPAAAKCLVEEHGIPRVLIGLGGQTPEQYFKHNAETSAIPKDYQGYRDSKMKQALIWPLQAHQQVEVKENATEAEIVANGIVEEIVQYALFFAPYQDPYQVNHIQELLQASVTDKQCFIILPTYSACHELYSPITAARIKAQLDPMIGTQSPIFMIQAVRLQHFWQAVIMRFDMSNYNPNNIEESLKVFFLHPAAKSIDRNAFSKINPFILQDQILTDFHPCRLYQNKFCYSQAPYHSGAWLIATLKLFIEENTNYIKLYAGDDFYKLIEEHAACIKDMHSKPERQPRTMQSGSLCK